MQIIKLIVPALLLFINLNFSINPKPIQHPFNPVKDSVPPWIKGDFMDDYGINYTISDSLWWQKPKAKYHIIKWDRECDKGDKCASVINEEPE